MISRKVVGDESELSDTFVASTVRSKARPPGSRPLPFGKNCSVRSVHGSWARELSGALH